MELSFIKMSGALVPFDDYTDEYISKKTEGSIVTGKFSQPRNYEFHKKFFSMIDFAFDYWEPRGGLIQRCEEQAVRRFAQYIDDQTGGESGTVAMGDFLDRVELNRSEAMPAPEKSKEAFRQWLISQAGFFTWVMTPTGPVKKPSSISFSRMSQEEFEELYKAVFSIVWRMVLSDKFRSEEEATQAINAASSYA